MCIRDSYKGLPPAPIVTPDISAIEAVLNPQKHSFIYFVADVSNPGYHLFSRTNAEHNRKKRQYTNWLKKNKIRRSVTDLQIIKKITMFASLLAVD